MAIDSRIEILQRLHKIERDVSVVIEMAESGQSCERILYQLHAAQSALCTTALKLILLEAEGSYAVILNDLSSKKRITELKRLQILYMAFLQHSNHHREVLHE